MTQNAHRALNRWTLVIITLLAWALRTSLISHYPLHPDEALYGYWGLLIGRGRDPWLATVPVYKPPLWPYLLAGTEALLGRSKFAVRLPGLFTGLLTVPLTAALARALYHDRRTACMAAIGTALSPLTIAFSASAFLDPPMTALGLSACTAALCNRPRWAGILAGLSFATKQTGLIWLPLIMLFQVPQAAQSPRPRRQSGAHLIQTLLGFSPIVGLIFAWDAVRVARGAGGFWRVGLIGYGGLRLIWPQELAPRLRGWIATARHIFTSPVINGVLLIGLPLLTLQALKRRFRTREAFVDLTLISFSLIYFLLHWLIAFPVWARYLLPLAPVLAILLGRAIHTIASHLPDSFPISPSVISSFIICSFVICSFGHHPITSDRAAYEGIEQATAFLERLPEGSVVYQHWLGWQYHFYLFDAPVYLAYWPTLSWLARDVQVFGEREPRYITFPAWESPARVEHTLNEVGYGLQPALSTSRQDGTPSFTVYRITPATSRTGSHARRFNHKNKNVTGQ